MWGERFYSKDVWCYRKNIFEQNWKQKIKLLCSYFQTDECRNLFEISLIINSGENTWNITEETIEVLLISNHEKPDTKLICHSGMSNNAAVIAAKDTDMFLFIIYALGKLECSLPSWYMKIDSN